MCSLKIVGLVLLLRRLMDGLAQQSIRARRQALIMKVKGIARGSRRKTILHSLRKRGITIEQTGTQFIAGCCVMSTRPPVCFWGGWSKCSSTFIHSILRVELRYGPPLPYLNTTFSRLTLFMYSSAWDGICSNSVRLAHCRPARSAFAQRSLESLGETGPKMDTPSQSGGATQPPPNRPIVAVSQRQ